MMRGKDLKDYVKAWGTSGNGRMLADLVRVLSSWGERIERPRVRAVCTVAHKGGATTIWRFLAIVPKAKYLIRN